jgi:hypothetical protein
MAPTIRASSVRGTSPRSTPRSRSQSSRGFTPSEKRIDLQQPSTFAIKTHLPSLSSPRQKIREKNGKTSEKGGTKVAQKEKKTGKTQKMVVF